MYRKFFLLEWKSFIRSASFKANLILKIFMGLGILYFMAMFLILGFALYPILEKMDLQPFETVNRFLIYYLFFDLAFRYFLQKMPVMNIRTFLYINIPKSKIVNYTLGKTVTSFFNWTHLFFLIPFSATLIVKGFDTGSVAAWFFSMLMLILANNFLNVLINNKDYLFYTIIGLLIVLGAFQYYQVFDLTLYTQPVFSSFYEMPWLVAIPVLIVVLLYYFSFRLFKSNLYLDAGLSIKTAEGKTEDYTWLNQFGTLGTFLKNDIKLIRRNKRSRTTVLVSAMFLLYGLLFFTGSIEAYNSPVWHIFAGIFVSGGFLFTFGQFVPSWDSSYYPLMMSQNIKYREYLNAKWWLIVIATTISTLLSSFYLYFGWEVYLAIIVGAIYNIGVNAHIVLWGGAYIKTPIDLTQNKNVFGDKQAFNIKSMLLTLPKLALPMVIYAAGHFMISPNAGFAMVAVAGILGFALKGKVFETIENIYRSEKYKTIAAYKQK